MISIDVFICTYKRVNQLERCLNSFSLLADEDGVNIFVVDNDPDASARLLVKEKFKKIHYKNEKRKGLSYARNFALDNGSGDYIAFIDDDEVVTKKWLYEARFFLEKNTCDVMFGGVKSIYPENTEDWILELDVFAYPTRKHGDVVEASGAGNVFISRNCINKYGFRFDNSFSFTGGEDSMLFRQMGSKGLLLLWNDNIEVYEYVEGNRINLRYLLRRSYRDGQCYARSYLGNVNYIKKIIWFVKRFLKIPIDVVTIIFSFVFLKKKNKVESLRIFLKNIGQLSILSGRFIKMYE